MKRRAEAAPARGARTSPDPFPRSSEAISRDPASVLHRLVRPAGRRGPSPLRSRGGADRDRPSRARRLPPGPSGGGDRGGSGGRGPRLGHCRRLAAQPRDARRPRAAGRALHGRGALGRGRQVRGDRRDPAPARGAREPRGGARPDGGARDAHRLADGDREGLLPQSGDGRTRRRPSRHRPRPRQPARAPLGAGLPGRGAAPAARGGPAALHGPLLRQPSGQRRDGAPRRVGLRGAARRGARPSHRPRRPFPSTMVDRIVPATTDADRRWWPSGSGPRTPGR